MWVLDIIGLVANDEEIPGFATKDFYVRQFSKKGSGCSVGVCVCTVDRKFVQLKIPRQATVQRDLKCYSAVLSQNCAVPMALRKAKSAPGEENRSCNLMVFGLPEEYPVFFQKTHFPKRLFSIYNGLSKREACDLHST
eukprot:sb/3474452/